MVELSVMDVLKIILSRIWIVIISGILCGVIAFVYCTMIAVPTYKATAKILGSNGNVAVELDDDYTSSQVSSDDDSIKASDYSVSEALIKTYVLMLSNLPAESEEFRTRLEEENLWEIFNQSRYNISSNEDTLIIEISITSTSHEAAKRIANIYAETAEGFIADYNIGLTKVLAAARTHSKVFPNTFMMVAVAVMIGAVIAALIAIYLETSNKVISGEDDIKSNYELSILGVVPDFHISAKGGK